MKDNNIDILKSIINDGCNIYISFDDIPVFYADVLKEMVQNRINALKTSIRILEEGNGYESSINSFKAELEFFSLLLDRH